MFFLFCLLCRGRFGGRRRQHPVAAVDQSCGNQNEGQIPDQSSNHLELSRVSKNGLPTRPSIVATAVWKFCSASCSRSSACKTEPRTSSSSSKVKRPCR